MPLRPLSLARRALYATLTLMGFLVLAETTTRLLRSGPDLDGRMPSVPRQRWTLPAEGEMHLGGVSSRINFRGYRGPVFEEGTPGGDPQLGQRLERSRWHPPARRVSTHSWNG